MTALFGLTYVSQATRDLSVDEIDRILEGARAGNEKHQVTGVLLFSKGNFMQYLEGPAKGMAAVYGSIKSSSLHRGIIELFNEPLVQREFGSWSMAFRSPNVFGVADPWLNDALLTHRLDASEASASPVRVLLSSFWRMAQRPSAF